MRSKREYFANLDMLRFLAALWVVITHYGYIGPSMGVTGYNLTENSVAAVFFKYGYLGVPLFFILSGFVISHVSANSTGWKDAPQFMANRISRLMPAFWACMTISAIAIMMLGFSDAVSLKIWAANLILLPQALGQPFVDGVYWTLVLEFVFYGWVFLLIGFGVFHRNFLTVCGAWLAISFANIFVLNSAIIEMVFITYYAGAFVAGMVIWHARGHGWSKQHFALLLLAAASLSLGIRDLGTQDHLANFNAAPALWVTTLCSFLCIGAVFLGVYLKDIPVKKSFALALGAISYPLYLLHQEAGYAVLRLTSEIGFDPLLVASTLTLFFIGLAYLVHVTLEKPIRAALVRILDIILSLIPSKRTLQAAE